MSIAELTENLKFRSHAMAFASSSSGNKHFTVEEEVGYNIKNIFRKPKGKITHSKINNLCTRCLGTPHSSRPCPAINKKATHVRK